MYKHFTIILMGNGKHTLLWLKPSKFIYLRNIYYLWLILGFFRKIVINYFFYRRLAHLSKNKLVRFRGVRRVSFLEYCIWKSPLGSCQWKGPLVNGWAPLAYGWAPLAYGWAPLVYGWAPLAYGWAPSWIVYTRRTLTGT